MTRFDLQNMTVQDLVNLANARQDTAVALKANLVEFMVKTLDVGEEKVLFESLCGDYGLKPEDWGKPFIQGRTTLRITGFKPHKPKNKFNLTNQNGKGFHCGESFLRRYLGKPVAYNKFD